MVVLHRVLSTAVTLCLIVPAVALAASVESRSATPAYLQRGTEVEGSFQASRERLQHLYDALLASLRRDDPELAAKLVPQLKQAAPKPVPHGYQILPTLVPDPAPRAAVPPAERPRAKARCYSWPWTKQLIGQQLQKVAALQVDLERAATRPRPERDAAYDKLVREYRAAADWQRTIDAHIHYNRLWQPAIAKDRPGYDRQTVLCHAVLERQAIEDALQPGDDGAFRSALRDITLSDVHAPREALEPLLRARAQLLAGQIHDASDQITLPAFLQVEHVGDHLWVVTVPIYTDVADRAFVDAFRNAVERTWQVRDGENEFRLHVAITTISPARLYGQQSPPQAGQPIDLDAHCARFPTDGAVLTTGADSTHVAAGRCIGVGPHDIAGHVLAHEFGHVLGFRDVYFRGYRDLGPDGYEVMEVVADPGDIMGDPGSGPVLPRHFEKLLGKTADRPPP